MKKERQSAKTVYAKTATASSAKPARSAASAPPRADSSSFASLLQQEFKPQAQAVHGVVLGKLLALNDDGSYAISLNTLNIAQINASAACAPALLSPGMTIAVMFLQGDTTRPLIIGPLHDNKPVAPALELPNPVQSSGTHEFIVNQERIVLQAGQELELRCGEAAIVLTSDGRILLRGAYISSHATATQRLLGGSVQIN